MATEKPVISKACPACGKRLVVRRNRYTTVEFLGGGNADAENR